MSRKLRIIVLSAVVLSLVCLSASAQRPARSGAGAGGNSFTDSRDRQTYRTVKIGNLTWMAENLNYNAPGSICYGEGGLVYVYDDENEREITAKLSDAEVRANCAKYGRLYNWNTAMSACPAGWRLPTLEDWSDLMDIVDGAGKIKSKTGWSWGDDGGNGTDDFGFSAMPGGNRNRSDGTFNGAGWKGVWWSATDDVSDGGWEGARVLIIKGDDGVSLELFPLGDGLSVRCIQ